jgi:hypothetical protein
MGKKVELTRSDILGLFRGCMALRDKPGAKFLYAIARTLKFIFLCMIEE